VAYATLHKGFSFAGAERPVETPLFALRGDGFVVAIDTK